MKKLFIAGLTMMAMATLVQAGEPNSLSAGTEEFRMNITDGDLNSRIKNNDDGFEMNNFSKKNKSFLKVGVRSEDDGDKKHTSFSFDIKEGLRGDTKGRGDAVDIEVEYAAGVDLVNLSPVISALQKLNFNISDVTRIVVEQDVEVRGKTSRYGKNTSAADIDVGIILEQDFGDRVTVYVGAKRNSFIDFKDGDNSATSSIRYDAGAKMLF